MRWFRLKIGREFDRMILCDPVVHGFLNILASSNRSLFSCNIRCSWHTYVVLQCFGFGRNFWCLILTFAKISGCIPNMSAPTMSLMGRLSTIIASTSYLDSKIVSYIYAESRVFRGLLQADLSRTVLWRLMAEDGTNDSQWLWCQHLCLIGY